MLLDVEVNPPDYEAIAHRLICENERLRALARDARYSIGEELAYQWDALLRALAEPQYQVLLMVAVPILLTLMREVFKLIQQRRSHRNER